ncbi:thiamine pyrophosphate-dependent enzyme [Actinoalloteichus spitiensis]|uniref:thiamine pyrophosphate-dependent enzyme n=1 Tax=Actinoalloteichus spitiensis TaxID=252394 RepID=UPI0012F67DBB|nr:thiamine pyrophosphate-dependent enzyme [Actinoalloteichus spitiensis]
MNKASAIRAIISATTNEPIVFTTGYSCRIAQAIADRPNHFYMTGSMGLATSIATGVALVTGGPTVVVDGDGSLLMNPAALVTAGAMSNLGLLHVVLDDGLYASTGGQSTPSGRTDLGALARACGYDQVLRVAEDDAFAAALSDVLAHRTTPVFIHCVLSAHDSAVPPRVSAHLGEHQRRFRHHIQSTMTTKV